MESEGITFFALNVGTFPTSVTFLNTTQKTTIRRKDMNDMSSTLVAHCGARKVTREELKELPMPEATRTHQPLSHYEIVGLSSKLLVPDSLNRCLLFL